MCSQHFEPTRDDLRSALAYGVGIWALATTVIVIAGPILVPAAGSAIAVGVTVLYALGALLVSYLAYSVYRLRRPDTLMLRLVFGTTAAASGLILDAVTYAVRAGRYPALSGSQQGSIAFFLVAAYGAMLLAPHLRRRRG